MSRTNRLIWIAPAMLSLMMAATVVAEEARLGPRVIAVPTASVDGAAAGSSARRSEPAGRKRADRPAEETAGYPPETVKPHNLRYRAEHPE